MADNRRGGFFGRIRGNAEWDATKAAIRWGQPMIYGALAALYEHLRHLNNDWLLIGGMGTLGLASAVVGFVRNRPRTIQATSTQTAPTALIEPSLKESFLNPLQVEALRLAKELSDFLVRLGPEPTIDPELQKDKTYAGNERALIEMYARQSEWEPRFQGEYALSFRDRVTRIIHIFAVQGLHDERLTEIARQEPVSDETVRDIRSRLIALAMKMDEPPFPLNDFSDAGKVLRNLAGGTGYMESYNHNPQFRNAADMVATKVNNENRISRRAGSV